MPGRKKVILFLIVFVVAVLAIFYFWQKNIVPQATSLDGTSDWCTYSWLPISSKGYNSAYQVKDGHVYFVDGGLDYKSEPNGPVILVVGADTSSFMESWEDPSPYELYIPYAKDKNHVYYRATVMTGIDPTMFKVPFDENCNAIMPAM